MPSALVHLDVAAAGRPSRAVLDAQVAHLRREAELASYVAEEQAGEQVEALRAGLGALVGLGADDVALVDGAGTAFATLLTAWPLGRAARIGMVPSEYGPNARLLRRLAPRRGWRLEMLPVDPAGRVVDVPDGLDLITFPHVPSQRGIVQPVADVFATGTPLLLDVAQSLGQVEVPAGCAAYVGTSRKWLCGPRGVGFAVVDPVVQEALEEPAGPTSATHARRWDSAEAPVAARVGLATAVRSWAPEVVQVAHERARQVRTVLDGVGGWSVREPVDEPSGITTLAGGDPFGTRARLLEEGFVTSAVPTSRSDDLKAPVLRVSTAAWVQPEQVDALAAALRRRGK